MAVIRRRLRMEATTEDAPASTLELFFDLVFVFALTQVTAYLADNLTWHGLIRGVLIFGLLWWSWVGYAWLCNVVRADEGVIRTVLLTAMAAMFVLALTIPEAFVDLPGGLPGPVVVAVCYFVFRVLHLSFYWVIARDDPGLRRQLLRFTPAVIGGTALLLVASQLHGTAQTAVWAVALLVDYGGTFLGGAAGWRLRSVGHFVERHGLMLIVALGESLVAIGVGVAHLPISWPVIVGAMLGFALAGALWWAYFDVTALMAERAFAGADPRERAAMARDAYSFLHFPLVGGVVLLALGLKKVLEYVGDSHHHELSEPLTGIGLYALYGGVAIYLLGHIGFKLRLMRTLSIWRVAAVVAILALIPVATMIPALAALALLAAVMVATMAVETIRLGEQRYRLRHETGHSTVDHSTADGAPDGERPAS